MGGIDKEATPAWLADGVKYVRILWCDVSGQRRCRMVPASKFKSGSFSKLGVGMAKAVISMPSCMDTLIPGIGLTATGEIRLVPDLSTGHAVLQQPGHALVLGDMLAKPGETWELCPRGTLHRLVKLLDAEFGLEMKAGFEMEFYLLRQLEGAGKYELVDTSRYCSTTGFNTHLHVIETILSSLESLGVGVDQFHCEGGPGQLECPLTYDSVSKSADNLLFAREAVITAALSHQLVATFLPKPPFDGAAFGSGNHCHMSIWKDGKNVVGVERLSDTNRGVSDLGENFFAGILHHLPALMVFVASHSNSYDRIVPHSWSGAFQCWGIENREAALRAVLDVTTGAVNNFEMKTFDGCSNPHLALSAILAAGIDGLRKKMLLPEPVDEDPSEVEKGKVARLPTNLKEAIEKFKEDEALNDILGKELSKVIVAVHEYDDAFFTKNPIKVTFPLDPHVIPLLHMF